MTESKQKGITLIEARVKKQWRAKCYYGGKSYHVGYYDTEIDAINARDEFLAEKTSVYTLNERKVLSAAFNWYRAILIENPDHSGYIEKLPLDDMVDKFINHVKSGRKISQHGVFMSEFKG